MVPPPNALFQRNIRSGHRAQASLSNASVSEVRTGSGRCRSVRGPATVVPTKPGSLGCPLPASQPACVLVSDQASMNCGSSAGTIEYPARLRISAPHIAATIPADGRTAVKLPEAKVRHFGLCAF
jgi:hypothetical protein